MIKMYKEHIDRLGIEYLLTRDENTLDELNYTRLLLQSVYDW